ncbi:lipid A export permease/ATP-binding protein MsbA [Undibacterium sp. RuRC25W]|uniref:lipid A export permease/ATP-binding protein MsbA n=1 Tax=Undibacterium sp. RuRC25W TaxID=3413047 RepID=UPI003BF0A984
MTINPYFVRLWRAVKPYKNRIGLALLGMIGAAMTEPIFPALMKKLTDNGFSEDKTMPVWMVPLGIVGIFFARGICTFCTQYYMSWIGNKLLSDMRGDMFKRTLDVPISYYQYESSGRLINTIISEVQQVVEMVKVSINTLIRDTITVFALIIFLVYQNWQLTIVALLIVPSMAYVVRLTGKRLRLLNQNQLKLNSELTQVVEEATRASQVIRIFGAQAYEYNRFHKKSEQLRGYAQRVTVASGSTTPITQMVAALAVSLVVIVAMRPNILPFHSDHFTPGDFIAYLTAMLLLLAPLKRLSDLNGPLQRGLIASESVFNLIDTPAEPVGGFEFAERAKGDLEFVNTEFTYERQELKALKGINLCIKAGETVALVGMSGGGKTSLVNLVPRFYAPTAGAIKLDGRDLADISISSLRAQIAMVGQSVVLFDDTIAANIAYGDSNPDQARIDAAVSAAHLSDVIADLPLGLQTEIGDNGTRLSGGQRQRLAIARAIYKNAPILILDEATSALDSESERAVQAALDTLIQGRTTLVIAHRLSTIERADRIVVLTDGEISEMGTHAELLQKNGTYAHLHQLQFSAEAQN